MKLKHRNILALAFLGLGMCQLLGYWLNLPILRGIGAASAASPFPKVFSDVDGLETFASRFTLYYAQEDGQWAAIPVGPELYQQLGGSYNRRNVYGAALSYGPRLPAEVWEPVLAYGLAEGGPLREEMGLPERGAILVHIKTGTKGRADSWILALDAADHDRLKQWLAAKGGAK